MSSSSGSERLSDDESADLSARVERFRAAWAPDGSTDLSATLPPPGAPHRRAVLVQIVRADMEQRAAARLPFRAERYVGMFPDDLTSNTIPAELLAAEYRLRHQHTDRPPLSEYERWFPDQYPAMLEELRRDPPAASGLNATVPSAAKPLVPTRRSDVTPVVPSGDVLPSDTPYHLVRKLGEGAFGEVYEARAPGGIRVAVKRILRNVNHPASMAEYEALESIKNLSHPFLLKTNAYWVFDDRLVIVMELADGSLADRIEYHALQGRTGIPPEELIPLFEQAGEALDYLHSENVSHRDIKPENVLILRGYAKVADFGLVRAHEHTMTNVGGTAGTPAYMAPEMWQQKVSLQSDQYSLAATYVRCRLGHHLYQTSILIDLANSHVNGTPDLSPLPDAEQRVLLRALAKNPDHRYESCAAFAKALRAAVFPPPEPPRPPAPAADRRPLNPLVMVISVAVAVAVSVAVAVGLVMAFFMPKQTQPSDAGKAPPDPTPPKVEKPLVGVPDWSADAGAGEKTIGEKRYPLRLTRAVGEDTLVALLIYPTDSDQSPPFYMLETKISNRVFASVWEEAWLDIDAVVHRWTQQQRDALILKDWKKGAVDHAQNVDPPARLGIVGDQANVPVLGVTVPEAILVANKLGGALPKFRQWVRATGALEKGDDRTLSAGPPRGDGFTDDSWRAELRRRELGLGLDRPLAVTAGKDTSRKWKVRQLLTNGPEWIGQASSNDGERIQLTPAPHATDKALNAGQNYHHTIVMDFNDIMETGSESITRPRVGTGFRIVLEP